jgi:hypothetical protein
MKLDTCRVIVFPTSHIYGADAAIFATSLIRAGSRSPATDGPRYLIRLMLPTVQTQISMISTLLDLLMGETQAPLPKPQWMVELCKKGVVIEVEIQSATHLLAVGRRGVAQQS